MILNGLLKSAPARSPWSEFPSSIPLPSPIPRPPVAAIRAGQVFILTSESGTPRGNRRAVRVNTRKPSARNRHLAAARLSGARGPLCPDRLPSCIKIRYGHLQSNAAHRAVLRSGLHRRLLRES